MILWNTSCPRTNVAISPLANATPTRLSKFTVG